MKKVFVVGEGANDIGDYAGSEAYLGESINPGFVGHLLRKIGKDYFQIIGGIPWRKIRKIRPGKSRQYEHRAVLGAALAARERGADVLVFVRDRDGSREREAQIEGALAEERERHGAAAVVGGVAVERLESWLAALCGCTKSETRSRAQVEAHLADHGVALKSSADLRRVIEEADLASIPEDATSLRKWLGALEGARV